MHCLSILIGLILQAPQRKSKFPSLSLETHNSPKAHDHLNFLSIFALSAKAEESERCRFRNCRDLRVVYRSSACEAYPLGSDQVLVNKKEDPVTRIRVRFDETDQQGVVHHANYIRYFEIARVEFFRSIGFSYKEFEDSGFRMVVAEILVKYRSPAYFDDLLDLFVDIEKMGSASLSFRFQIKRDQESIALGHAKLACLGSKNRPIRFPAIFKDALKAVACDKGD